MEKELDAIGNWRNRIVLGFRCERFEGLEVLSFWSDSGARRSKTGRDENSAAYKVGKSLGFNRRRLYSISGTGLAVAYIYDCASVSLPRVQDTWQEHVDWISQWEKRRL